MRRRTLLVLAAGFAGFVGLVGLWLTVDAAAPDDADLILERVEVPRADNGYVDYQEAIAHLYFPHRSVIGKFEDTGDPTLLALVEKNQAVIHAIRQSLLKPHFQFDDSAWLTVSGVARGILGELIQIRIVDFRRQGRFEDAVEECLWLMRQGQAFRSGEGGILTFFFGQSSWSTGVRRLLTMIAAGELDEESLLSLRIAARALAPQEREFTENIQHSYRLLVDSLNGESGLMFKPNRTRRELARLYRLAIEDYSRPFADRESSKAVEEIERRAPFHGYLTSNRDGEVIVQLIGIGGFDWASASHEKFDQRALEILIAAQLYRLAHGKLPVSLKALVPEFLESVPLDPYDGAPLRYSRSGGFIYAVGENLVDDGSGESEYLRIPLSLPTPGGR